MNRDHPKKLCKCLNESNPMPDLTAQSVTLSTGHKLAFAEYGDPAGVPMFYFHGWPSSRLQGAFLDSLGRRKGLRVIAPDRPGLGLSDYQPNRQLLDWPPILTELADHLGFAKFHVLGVSGGGPYVLVTAHMLSERVLSAGVICGAPSLRIVGTEELMWTYKLGLWAQMHTPWLLAPGLLAAAQYMTLPVDSSLVKAYVAKLCPQDQLAMRDPALYRILMESGRVGLLSGAKALSTDGNIYMSDWGFDLKSVTYPIHYWHGARDTNISLASVEKFLQHLPNAKFTITPEDGHYSLPMLRNAEIVEELLRSSS
jgi:pimeloyl-ACP methyl ester carboxylesterase